MAARTIVAQPIPSTGKHIRFDRLTKDFAMYLDGQYIGSRGTYDEAETELDRVAAEQARQLAADLADEAADPLRAVLVRPSGEWYVAELDGREVGQGRTAVEALANATLTDDPCDLCGDPATVTLRVSGETLRLCRPCFDAGWGENEANLESWEADFDASPGDEPPPVPPGQGGDSPETGPYADDVAELLTAPAHALWGLADFAAEYDAQARLQRALASWSTAQAQETSHAA